MQCACEVFDAHRGERLGVRGLAIVDAEGERKRCAPNPASTAGFMDSARRKDPDGLPLLLVEGDLEGVLRLLRSVGVLLLLAAPKAAGMDAPRWLAGRLAMPCEKDVLRLETTLGVGVRVAISLRDERAGEARMVCSTGSDLMPGSTLILGVSARTAVPALVALTESERYEADSVRSTPAEGWRNVQHSTRDSSKVDG